MKDTLRTICLALTVGLLAGAEVAAYLLALDAHGKTNLEVHAGNGQRGLGDATGRPPRFWGLQLGHGDSLTAIGVYCDRAATSSRNAAPTPARKLSLRLPE
jgi:hypothetical protein